MTRQINSFKKKLIKVASSAVIPFRNRKSCIDVVYIHGSFNEEAR
jgi:hypothetical protein